MIGLWATLTRWLVWMTDQGVPRLFYFFLLWQTRYVLAWLLALGGTGNTYYQAWIAYDNSDRADGNAGHTYIDFAGQWLMGRLLVTGNGQQLYHRDTQRRLLVPAFPPENEVPLEKRGEDKRHDLEAMMDWLMGTDDPEPVASTLAPLGGGNALGTVTIIAAGQGFLPAEGDEPVQGLVGASRVELNKGLWQTERFREACANRGGPLYPPINGFIYAPLGLFGPQTAYRIMQGTLLAMAFVAGAGVSFMTRRRIWCPIAVSFLLIYPGFGPSVKLGQNPILTLTILIWGWALVARGWPRAGGMVWGLFAFKPVWALAFFLVPLVTGRWRVCLAMIVSGVALVAATLPWVGMQSWIDWLKVGRVAALLYNVDENWVFLSRDLLSMPRRWLLDFKIYPLEDRDRLLAGLLGWAFVAVALELTVRMARMRPLQARQPLGPYPAFLFLGAWMCCYHFMYYDVLLTALPFFLLLHAPWSYLDRHCVLLAPSREPVASHRGLLRYLRLLGRMVVPLSSSRVGVGLAKYLRPWLPTSYPGPVPLLSGRPAVWVFNQAPLYFLIALWVMEHAFPHWDLAPSTYNEPWDAYGLIVIWLWCGWTWLREAEKPPAV